MSTNLITPSMHEGELRILDTELAARLGFVQPRDIRKLIARHRGALSKLGKIHEQDELVGKGQKVKAYYLNKKQAIFITAKSETPEATAITIEIIERFDAYERGEAPGAIKAPTNMREALLLALEQQEKLDQQNRELEVVRPKARALDELAGTDGTFGLREAAKLCDWPESKFIQRLHEMRWIFKQEPTRPWQAHADRLREGVLAHKTYEQTKPNGEVSARYQVMVTAKGLTKLATVLGPTPEGKRAVPFAPKREAAA